MSNSVIITAGGRGTRMSSTEKKQFMKLNGRPLLFCTIDKFVKHDLIDEIIVVLPDSELVSYKKQILQEFSGKPIVCTAGASSRQESVYNGLNAIDDTDGIVLIHDGVRPFIEKEEISLLIRTAEVTGGVIPATRVKNTVKRVEGDIVTETLDRDKLIQVHTPQVFSKELILKCHEAARHDCINRFTDDASILEYYGYKVKYIICSDRNIKITNPIDLLIAEYILKEGQDDK